ncbi:hypothetical protein D3C72_2337560 [compost metagenome]
MGFPLVAQCCLLHQRIGCVRVFKACQPNMGITQIIKGKWQLLALHQYVSNVVVAHHPGSHAVIGL